MSDLTTGKIILAGTCGTYLLSAALLSFAKPPAPAWVVAGWAVAGLVGLALVPALTPGRTLVQVAVLVAMAPWMAYAAWGDGRGGHWVMVVIDVAGLAAIGFGLMLVRRATTGG